MKSNVQYWAERQADTQRRLTDQSIKSTEKQLTKYYKTAMKRVITDFEDTYNKLLLAVGNGKKPTPADLYKLDRYWKMQAQLQKELQKLGDFETKVLSQAFIDQYETIYNSIALKGEVAFTEASLNSAEQIINEVWCADGENWSQRIWKNTDKLHEELNENLVHCVVAGKKPDYLKKKLMERFNVSHYKADRIVRTEMCRIQTQAAQQRYKDYGLKYYEFLADPDERTCEICAQLDGKRFLLEEMQAGVNAPPMHPNDRCCIIPVIEK